MTGSLEIESTVDREPQTTSASEPVLAWAVAAEPTDLGFGPNAEPLLLDWSGQGTLDLIVTAGSDHARRRARLYRPLAGRDGGDLVYDAGQDLDGLGGLRSLCALRNDRESRFDLIGLGLEGLVWLRNEGVEHEPCFDQRQFLGLDGHLGLGPCRVVQISSVDWDGDGRDDLLVGIDDLTDYWPDSDRVPAEQQKGFNQKAGHPSYDRQGLWRGRAPVGRLFWFRNVGDDEAPRFEQQPELLGEPHPLDVGIHPAPLGLAWERPRALQLLLTDRRGLVHVFRNFGDQRPPVLMEPRSLHCGGAPFLLPEDRTVVTARDLDQDRRDELVYGTSDGRVFAVHAGTGRFDLKTPHPIKQITPALWLGGNAVVTAGDLDGDGGLDLVSGVATGRLWTARDEGSAGNHRYRPLEPIEAGGAPFQLSPGTDGLLDGPVHPSLGFACPALVDWSRHGRLDLMVGGAGGDVLLLPNDGAPNEPRFGTPRPLQCDGLPLLTPPRVRPAAVDWSGQEGPDLIALDLQGFLCLYPRTERFEVGPPAPLVDRLGRAIRLDGGFGLSGRCALWAGPWCGSGRPDILVGLPRSNRHIVPGMTGVAFSSFADIPTVLLLENEGNGVLCPRPVFRADGRPLVIGDEGCSPMGVPSGDSGHFDLLVGGDDGSVVWLRRGELRW